MEEPQGSQACGGCTLIGDNWGMAKTMGRWLVPVLLGTALAGQAVCATAPAALQISTETAPAGGWAQIKIYAAKPVAIASGHLVLNLDATAFGTGAMVGLFGANGDAAGLAAVTGPQIDVQFFVGDGRHRPTGGIAGDGDLGSGACLRRGTNGGGLGDLAGFECVRGQRLRYRAGNSLGGEDSGGNGSGARRHGGAGVWAKGSPHPRR